MRKFCVGDVHGNFRALKQVLERSKFDYENDLLITLGDIVDGWSETYECVEELLKIKNRIDIRGNHDEWFQTYLRLGMHGSGWKQGAGATRESYLKHSGREGMTFESMWGTISSLNPADIPQTHKDFFLNQINYYVDDNKCFVHGGFDRFEKIKRQFGYTLYWDRSLWSQAQSCKGTKLTTVDNFDHIFIGHTHVDGVKNPKCLPLTRGGITNLDTGAGWSGKLTLMNIDNIKEFYQSDLATKLYPDEKGRR